MNNTPKPIGWATTISSLIKIPREMWDSVMTVEKSPLRNLDPMVGHMIFQCLFFIWSGIFNGFGANLVHFYFWSKYRMSTLITRRIWSQR